MSPSQKEIARSWEQRRAELGDGLRAVLFKNLPAWMNDRIHRRHIRLVLGALEVDYRRVLDVGCGYGRIASELKTANPGLQIEGVEISKGFCSTFSSTIGACFNVPIQEFVPEGYYDLINIVTVLMYLHDSELRPTVEKLWNCLRRNGKIVCIEPEINILVRVRKMLGVKKFMPTGSSVTYFDRSNLLRLFMQLPGARLTREETIGLIPVLERPVLHRAIVVMKTQS